MTSQVPRPADHSLPFDGSRTPTDGLQLNKPHSRQQEEIALEPDHELASGERLPVAAEYCGSDYTVYVLRRAGSSREWVVTWNDGINHWYEEWDHPELAFARLAALVAAANQQTFLVHDPGARGDHDVVAFQNEVERFLSRTVHTPNDPTNYDNTLPTHREEKPA